MNAINHSHLHAGQSSLTFSNLEYGRIIQRRGNKLQLDSGLLAMPADGLGIEVEEGDLVAYLPTDTHNFVVCLLQAANRKEAVLSYPFAPILTVRAASIEFHARLNLALKSAQEISLESCQNLRVSCRNLLQNAADSVSVITQHWIQNCRIGSVKADELLHTDAGNQVITADRDLRMDAERINMG